MTTTPDALLACPHCAAKITQVPQNSSTPNGVGWYQFIWCENCGAQGGERKTEAEAIEAWNTRALARPSPPSDAIAAMIDGSIEIDNGYRRCKLCKVISYTGEDILHNEHCPLPVAIAAMQPAQASEPSRGRPVPITTSGPIPPSGEVIYE